MSAGWITKTRNSMAASSAPAIMSPMHYDATFKVDVRLHEPLLSRGVTPLDVKMEMIALCSQLDTLCRKELNEQPSGSIEHGKVSNSFTNRATVVYDRMIHVLVKNQSLTQDCLRYLQSTGMDKLFPRAAAYVAYPETMSLTADKTSLDNYFSNLSVLNQLSNLARQINNDICNLPEHKYIAHQLALLYQTITGIKSNTFTQHRQSIEENFKVIKATLSENSTLTPEQQEWLLNLTNNVVSVVNTFPAELTTDLLQPATVVSRS